MEIHPLAAGLIVFALVAACNGLNYDVDSVQLETPDADVTCAADAGVDADTGDADGR